MFFILVFYISAANIWQQSADILPVFSVYQTSIISDVVEFDIRASRTIDDASS